MRLLENPITITQLRKNQITITHQDSLRLTSVVQCNRLQSIKLFMSDYDLNQSKP